MENPLNKDENVATETDSFFYETDEKILCYDTVNMIYAATVLQRKIGRKNNEALYLVHYKGWDSKWDEWVSSERCLKKTEKNEEKMNQHNIKQRRINNAMERKCKKKKSRVDKDSICNKCKEKGEFMLFCDGCKDSFHLECVGLTEMPDSEDDYYCNKCVKKGKNKRRK